MKSKIKVLYFTLHPPVWIPRLPTKPIQKPSLFITLIQFLKYRTLLNHQFYLFSLCRPTSPSTASYHLPTSPFMACAALDSPAFYEPTLQKNPYWGKGTQLDWGERNLTYLFRTHLPTLNFTALLLIDWLPPSNVPPTKNSLRLFKLDLSTCRTYSKQL